MQDSYLFKNGFFVILDQELNIDIKERLKIRKIPKDLTSCSDLVLERHQGGTLHRVYFKKKEQFDGECLTYNSREQLEAHCYYQEGLLHGPSRFFSKTGLCLSESWYYKGKKEGKQRRWFSCGQCASIERYRSGVLHGKQHFYQMNGQIRSQLHYDTGHLEGQVLLFWPNGVKKREVSFYKGRKVGLDVLWDCQGELIYSKEYRDVD